MDTADPLKSRVDEALARWKEKRLLLQAGSQALEIELERFVRGERSEPAELKKIVDDLRVECDSVLLELLEAVRAAHAAGSR